MSDAPVERPVRVGIFSTIKDADQAVHRLLAAGFTKSEITVVCSDEHKEAYFREFEHQQPAGTTTPYTATAGGVIGAVLGGLTAIAGATATGGVTLLVAGGIMTWAGGVVGGLVGAMMSRGVEKEVANFYDQAVTQGKVLIAVEDEGPQHALRLAKAEEIFRDLQTEPLRLPEG